MFEQKTYLRSGPVTVRIISSPTVEDVLAAETRAWLYAFSQGQVDDTRRVPLDIRNYLTRIGLER